MEQTGRASVDERVDERRTNTREQIRTVALEMFAERGYDGTSLREIAEQLGVTKAAVYYHFKTKEDILVSLLEDFLGQLDELLDRAEELPPGPDTRRIVVERYAELLSGRPSKLARFMQEGQAAIRERAAGLDLHKRFGRMVPLLADDAADPEAALRAQIAMISVHVGAFGPPHGKSESVPALHDDPEERRAAAVRIALELIGAGPTS
jgi:AcrR family transcriptional regulator